MITQTIGTHVIENKHNAIYPIYENDPICQKVIGALGYDVTPLVDKEYGKLTTINTLGKLPYDTITFIGLGKEENITTAKLREAFAIAFKQAKGNVSFDTKRALLETDTYTLADLAYLATESYILSKYEFVKIGHEATNENHLELIVLEDVQEAIDKAVIYANAVNHARDLGNMPSNMMTPENLADYAITLAQSHQLECTVLGNEELKELKAGALLGVNLGSKNEAKLIILKYQGNGDEPFTALVGKGLTFDSGGYNLKSTGGKMMKYDMCGGANVLGAMEIIAKRKLKANVIAVIPATENLISGEAYKADDVLVSMSGKSIEITNTDAEGRLILCDAITYAIRQGATRIIDIATLTGAIATALAGEYTGVFSNSDTFYEEFMSAAKQQDEKAWRMPTDEAFVKLLKDTKVADLVNSVAGSAGASIGACFLEQFIEDGVEWIHLDIAGTADARNDQPRNPKGATGVMARTLAQLFETV